MGLQNIFPTQIYTHFVPPNIADKMEEITTPKLNFLEEEVGMRTDFFMEEKILPLKEILPFINYINAIVDKFSEESGLYKGSQFEYWIQDYKKDHYHSTHSHPKSTISGTYYIRANSNAGDLEFQSPYSPLVYNTLYKGDYRKYATYKIKPAKGLLVLFPFWLSHQILPTNNNDCIRTSFSFNFGE